MRKTKTGTSRRKIPADPLNEKQIMANEKKRPDGSGVPAGYGFRQCDSQIQQSAGGVRAHEAWCPECGAVSCLIRSVPMLGRCLPSEHSYQRLLRLPAAGYRNNDSGQLNNVGSNGNYWSSSPYSSSSNNAGNLNFNSSSVNPLNNNNRANGRSVRCVQASAKAFLPFVHFNRCGHA